MQQVLQILVHSLYTDKDVFLRELVSNASDALDKIRFRSLTDQGIVDPDAELEIDISVDKSANKLTIRDTGIGMSRDEVNLNIGTIAHSGSREFLERLSAEQDEEQRLKLIGQFGVGFYSVFMIAERVVLTTRSADSDAEAVVWESTGDGSYTVATTRDKTRRGTEIEVFVRSDCEEYLDAHRLEAVVRRHSDYVAYPIKVAGKQANEASALWARPRSEITEEQYKEFYQHLSGDHQEPLVWEHVAVDVPIQFYAVLYVPRQSPLELLFSPDPKVRVNLHVKRVFIQDDCEVLPLYLRFVRGVVDCDDLPLNVARESLQNNPVVTKIRQTLTRRVLSCIEGLADRDPAAFLTFWESFGIVLKEGVARDFEHREQVGKLLRFYSSFSEKLADDGRPRWGGRRGGASRGSRGRRRPPRRRSAEEADQESEAESEAGGGAGPRNPAQEADAAEAGQPAAAARQTPGAAGQEAAAESSRRRRRPRRPAAPSRTTGDGAESAEEKPRTPSDRRPRRPARLRGPHEVGPGEDLLPQRRQPGGGRAEPAAGGVPAPRPGGPLSHRPGGRVGGGLDAGLRRQALPGDRRRGRGAARGGQARRDRGRRRQGAHHRAGELPEEGAGGAGGRRAGVEPAERQPLRPGDPQGGA